LYLITRYHLVFFESSPRVGSSILSPAQGAVHAVDFLSDRRNQQCQQTPIRRIDSAAVVCGRQIRTRSQHLLNSRLVRRQALVRYRAAIVNADPTLGVNINSLCRETLGLCRIAYQFVHGFLPPRKQSVRFRARLCKAVI
jgi:hypothetical protein